MLQHLQTLTSSSGALSRRRFLLGAAAVGGGLAVGFRAAEAADGPVQAQAPFAHTQVNPFSAYLTITPEGLVVVHSAHMDIGQGPYAFTIAVLGLFSSLEIIPGVGSFAASMMLVIGGTVLACQLMIRGAS